MEVGVCLSINSMSILNCFSHSRALCPHAYYHWRTDRHPLFGESSVHPAEHAHEKEFLLYNNVHEMQKL